MGGWVDTNIYIACLQQVVAFAPKVIIACLRQVDMYNNDVGKGDHRVVKLMK